MLFIMEGIDLAGVVDSDFQGIQINFALPRPAGFANFCGAGQDLFLLRGWAGRGSPFSAGRGGAHIPDVYLPKSIPLTKFTLAKNDFFRGTCIGYDKACTEGTLASNEHHTSLHKEPL